MELVKNVKGLGIKLNVDPNLVIPDERKSIADGAIEPWAKSTTYIMLKH